MFFRPKRVGDYTYLQIVENRRVDGKPRQRVVATVGRLDRLAGSEGLEALLESGSRFAEKLTVITAHRRGRAPAVACRRIGAPLLFERLWQETGCRAVIERLLSDRRFEFSVERAIFLEVLHRLVAPGSDRDGYVWRDAYRIAGAEELSLHHAYRAMAWLGEALGEDEATVKDRVEEELFARRRDLFSSLELVFFDTTSLYFEGQGGDELGRYGHSKDHRPDRLQMVVGVVLDQEGRPVCCEMWPGNATDVTQLAPLAERLGRRFGIERICLVADRGMIRAKTVAELDKDGWPYILGARMRSTKEVRDEVLSRAGRYEVVFPEREHSKDPSPLAVKEVWVDEHRYIVCRNEEQARKDRADREAIVAALEDRLRQGAKALVGNRGFRKYLRTQGEGFVVDEARIESEARYDGKWVLRTNTDHTPAEVALIYKQLWMVEDTFRTMKSLLATRPIYHRTDEAIRGHVFCSFLALVLRDELQDRLARKGYADVEWADLIRDLDRLEEVEIEKDGKRFALRSQASGTAGKVLQAAGVALPQTVRQVA